MHQAVFVNTLHRAQRANPVCAAGHRSHVASTVGLVARFAAAAVLFRLGLHSMTSLLMLPVAWTLLSVAAGIVASTFFQHANQAAGVCIDCEHEALPVTL